MDSIIRKHSAKKQKKNYFTKETEQAIVRYNNEKNFETRSNIYQKEIHYPFFKLTQNIIHTFKFYHTEVENLEDLQHEIMIFLLDKIHLFNPENGAKAYSYFGTIVKRWLIVYTTKNYNKKLSNIPISDLNNYSNLDMSSPSFVNSAKMDLGVEKIIEGETKDELDFQGYKSSDKLSLFVDQYVEFVTDNIYDIFKKPYDAQIADAILELFRKRDNIDIFNKKALYIYIREQVDVKTPKITKIANVLYKIFKEKYLFYLETGAFPS
tara:strand:- start:1391 stop:2188 length:798 start_codon:yes stop_codon:yes gene_type:complete